MLFFDRDDPDVGRSLGSIGRQWQLDRHSVERTKAEHDHLNGYVPRLQTPGGVWWFLRKHLGYAIASPAILEEIGTRFRRSVSRFADANRIPVVRFGKDDRKIDVMRRHVAAQAGTGRSGVAAIGTAQEIQNVFAATLRDRASGGAPNYSFTKANRPILVFYFYLWDAEFGPAFIKIASYFPYPMKMWVNGHEWASVSSPSFRQQSGFGRRRARTLSMRRANTCEHVGRARVELSGGGAVACFDAVCPVLVGAPHQ